MDYHLTNNQIKTVVLKASESLADYCMTIGLHYVVTGSSGGLDSAVTLALAERAGQIAKSQNFDLTSIALILPCESEPEEIKKGFLAAKKFGAKTIVLNIYSMFECFMESIVAPINGDIREILKEAGRPDAFDGWSWSERIAQGNVKARLRMITIYHTAKMLNGMVLSTDNLSEFWMGFWTICGDVGDFNMIQNVLKGSELYDIAGFLEVPRSIIESKPSDGLKVSGSTEDQLGANYQTVDKIMIKLIQQGFCPDGSYEQLAGLPEIEGISPIVVRKIAERCLRGTYKRRGTITLSREELGLPAIEEMQL